MILINLDVLTSLGKDHKPWWFFKECVAKGSRFTLGVWGWRLAPLLRPQPSAARSRRQPWTSVRDGMRWGSYGVAMAAMAVLMASPANVVILRGFKGRVASLHVAGMVRL